MFLLDTKQKDEPLLEPSKQWKNKWHTTNPLGFSGHCLTCSSFHEHNEGKQNVLSCATYPSKEIAEQKSNDFLRYCREINHHDLFYQGAVSI